MKLVKKVFAVVIFATMLTGCGFTEIKSDKDIVTSETSATTTTVQVLEVPDTTTTTTPADTDEPVIDLPGEDVPPTEESPYPAVMISTANVNARRGPSTADEIAVMVIEGTEVTVLGITDGWYQVEIDGEQLYIIQDYLAEVETEDVETEEVTEE